MSITFSNAEKLSKSELETGSILAPRFDANGLVTAIAQEANSNIVLMLAHMNAEALRLTLETGIVHYYSRSRGKLWIKGETSGELQKLVEMRIDCDQDAILLIVEQAGRGAACHTGRKSCFYRKVDATTDGAALVDGGDKPLFNPDEVY